MIDRSGLSGKTALAVVLAALALSGCASVRKPMTAGQYQYMSAEEIATLSPSQRQMMNYRLETAFLSRPGNVKSGVAWSEYLKAEGRYSEANQVMREVAARNPDSGDALLHYAETQAALGHYPDALRTIRDAERVAPRDWRTFSQEGLILDQMGQPMEARMRYRQALSLSPKNPEVLSNMAVSYVLTHDLATAENYLREANDRRGASSEVQINLALVLALQGKQQEAQRVATAGVSAEQAQINLAALQAATAPGGAWEQFAVGAGG
ncbi:tetratricopeptide repeat protein [Martelella mangrovi]|uniref:Flp pilus assembly protein TadD n=1 Tax=Martelella mangrovi TaxID=1397477 RepID=A0ABV2IEG8_9HYPH